MALDPEILEILTRPIREAADAASTLTANLGLFNQTAQKSTEALERISTATFQRGPGTLGTPGFPGLTTPPMPPVLPAALRPPVPPVPPAPIAGTVGGPSPGHVPLPGVAGSITSDQQALIAALRDNTAALAANTAALLKGGGPAGGGKTTLPPGQAGLAAPPVSPGILDAITSKLDAAGSKIQQFGGIAQSAFGQATSSIFSFVQAIDPSAMSTLHGSVSMLSGEIGRAFVPFVLQASEGLQSMARWVNGLDEGFKGGLARVVSYGALGLGGLAIASRLAAGAFGLLSGAMRTFGMVASFVAAHPIVLTVTALTAGVITLTGQWNNLGIVAGRVLGVIGQGAQAGVAALGGLDRQVGHRQAVSDRLGQLRPEMAVAISSAPAGEKTQEVIDSFIQALETQLQREQQRVPQQLREEARADRERFNLTAEEGKGLQHFYRQQLDSLREETGKPGLTSIPEGTPQFQAVVAEAQRVRQNIVRAAKEGNIEMRPQDLEPFQPRRQAGLLGGSLQQFLPVPEPGQASVSRAATGGALNAVQEQARGLRQFIPDLASSGPVEAIQGQLRILRELAPLLGAKPGDNFAQNIKLPVQARFTDAASFYESVQTQALNVGDLEAEKTRRDMNHLLDRLGEADLIGGVIKELQALEKAMSNLRWGEGP